MFRGGNAHPPNNVQNAVCLVRTGGLQRQELPSLSSLCLSNALALAVVRCGILQISNSIELSFNFAAFERDFSHSKAWNI